MVHRVRGAGLQSGVIQLEEWVPKAPPPAPPKMLLVFFAAHATALFTLPHFGFRITICCPSVVRRRCQALCLFCFCRSIRRHKVCTGLERGGCAASICAG